MPVQVWGMKHSNCWGWVRGGGDLQGCYVFPGCARVIFFEVGLLYDMMWGVRVFQSVSLKGGYYFRILERGAVSGKSAPVRKLLPVTQWRV